jgi:hypothetical protein
MFGRALRGSQAGGARGRPPSLLVHCWSVEHFGRVGVKRRSHLGCCGCRLGGLLPWPLDPDPWRGQERGRDLLGHHRSR